MIGFAILILFFWCPFLLVFVLERLHTQRSFNYKAKDSKAVYYSILYLDSYCQPNNADLEHNKFPPTIPRTKHFQISHRRLWATNNPDRAHMSHQRSNTPYISSVSTGKANKLSSKDEGIEFRRFKISKDSEYSFKCNTPYIMMLQLDQRRMREIFCVIHSLKDYDLRNYSM